MFFVEQCHNKKFCSCRNIAYPAHARSADIQKGWPGRSRAAGGGARTGYVWRRLCFEKKRTYVIFYTSVAIVAQVAMGWEWSDLLPAFGIERRVSKDGRCEYSIASPLRFSAAVLSAAGAWWMVVRRGRTSPPPVPIRVERFDRRRTEPFEPFEPFEPLEFFQNRNFP